jgi:PAS domain S-box-containing protein
MRHPKLAKPQTPILPVRVFRSLQRRGLRALLSVFGWSILLGSVAWLVMVVPLPNHSADVQLVLFFQALGTAGLIAVLSVYELDRLRLERAERESREIRARYDALVSSLSEAVFLVGLKGETVGINRAGLEMLGYTEEEYFRRTAEDSIVPEERTEMRRVQARLIAGETLPMYQRRFRRKNGELRVGEVSATLVRDEEGNPRYIQSVVRDVTDRLRLEKERLELTIQQERNQLLNELIADFSHHVRTPLANIKNSAYLITRLGSQVDKVRQQVQVVDAEVGRMTTLLDNLITLTRLEREETATTLVGVPINALLYDLIPTPIGLSPADPAHTWEYTPDVSNPHVFGSRSKLSEAFRHMFSNAKLYTPQGGNIEVAVRANNNVVMVSIRDSGIGIAPDELPLVFNNFYRTDAARQISHQNGGLGLTIARRVIEMHRGVIDIKSEVGKGSTFTVYLPTDRTSKLDEHSIKGKINKQKGVLEG